MTLIQAVVKREEELVKRKFAFPLAILTVICMLVMLSIPQGKVFAEISDGTYSLNYQILHAESDSVSIANDYFEKPATLFVENGEKHIQFTLNHSQWTKELQAPLGGSFVDVDVVSENLGEDTRVVKFKLDEDLSKPLEFKMHVLIETMEPVYDHRYTVRFDFDNDSMEQISSAETTEEDNDSTELAADKDNEKQEANPKTGDRSPITLFIILSAVSLIVIIRPWRAIISNKN